MGTLSDIIERNIFKWELLEDVECNSHNWLQDSAKWKFLAQERKEHIQLWRERYHFVAYVLIRSYLIQRDQQNTIYIYRIRLNK